MSSLHRLVLLTFFCFGSFTLTSCSPEKARSLQASALQFRNESLVAITAITLRKRELEAPPRSPGEVRQTFISNILNSSIELNSRTIDLAIDPYRAPSSTEWDEFIQDLKLQYEQFSEIFDSLDSKPNVSRAELKKAADHARSLTVQMALFAKALSDSPPLLTQYRTRTLVKFRKVRREYQSLQSRIALNGSDRDTALQRKSDLENQTGELLNEWQNIQQDERVLLETTVAQCMRAATIGKQVIEAADRYDDLDISQLNSLIPRLFTTASSFTGKDYKTLQNKSTRLVTDLQNDPLWSSVAQPLINRMNNASQQRSSVFVPNINP
jgi:hypothetical protein